MCVCAYVCAYVCVCVRVCTVYILHDEAKILVVVYEVVITCLSISITNVGSNDSCYIHKQTI